MTSLELLHAVRRLRHPSLNALHKLALFVLVAFRGADGVSAPSIAQLAAAMASTPKTARRVVHQLVEFGFVATTPQVRAGRRLANRYTVLPNTGVLLGEGGGHSLFGEGGTPSSGRGVLPPGGAFEDFLKVDEDLFEGVGSPRSRNGVVDAVHRRYLEIRRQHRPKSRAPKLKSAERARAEKLLRDGYTQAELELACEGLFRSPHHLGQNDRSTEYLEFFHALSDKCIDGFIAAAEKAREEPTPRSPRPPTVYGPPAPAPPDLAEALKAFASGGIWTNPEGGQ